MPRKTDTYRGLDNRDLKQLNESDLEKRIKKFHSFIEAWETSSSAIEVTGKIKKSVLYCRSTATWLRNHGVQLKKFKPKVGLNYAEMEAFRQSLSSSSTNTK